jgi:hypothetical protein
LDASDHAFIERVIAKATGKVLEKPTAVVRANTRLVLPAARSLYRFEA